MRKSQQRTSRKRSARAFRLMAKHRRLKTWWRAMVVAPLKRMGCNSRPNRYSRADRLTRLRKEPMRYPLVAMAVPAPWT